MVGLDKQSWLWFTRQCKHYQRNGRQTMDRTELARALAKAIAYVNVGKVEEASVWLAKLNASFAAEGVVA